MDYEKKYKEITTGWLKCVDDISNEYPECNWLEKCIIALRKNKWTYANIQKKLGMPPKKQISEVLKKWAPELIDNSKMKIIHVSKWESELYNILVHCTQRHFEIEEEDYYFYIRPSDKKIVYDDEYSTEQEYNQLNEIMQQQFLIAIKQQLNEE